MHGARDVRPTLFVHVPGSGGSSLCAQARRQAHGILTSYNCLLPCKSPYDYRLYGLRPKAPGSWVCTRRETGWMSANCSTLASMIAKSAAVLGATETMLDEANASGHSLDAVERLYQPALLRGRRGCGGSCCFCNQTSVFGGCNAEPESAERLPSGAVQRWCPGPANRMLSVRRGGASPLDALWPLGAWRPLTTLCASVRHVFLMNEPLKRVATQLLFRCPWNHRVDAALNASCVPWAWATLREIYGRDLLLDESRNLFAGTPAYV
jgi:hypothetical protein